MRDKKMHPLFGIVSINSFIEERLKTLGLEKFKDALSLEHMPELEKETGDQK